MSRDGDANTFVNNIIRGVRVYTTTGGSPVNLVKTDTWAQVIAIPSGTIDIRLPVASTLSVGFSFLIVNQSYQLFSVHTSSFAVDLVTLSVGEFAIVTCILASGTTAASWAVAKAATNGVVNGQNFKDGSGVIMITGARQLWANDASLQLDWDTPGALNVFAALVDLTLSSTTLRLNSPIQDGSAVPTIDPNRQLLASDGSTVNLDWTDPTGTFINYFDDATTPSNPVTPVGYVHGRVNGSDIWFPYYQ